MPKKKISDFLGNQKFNVEVSVNDGETSVKMSDSNVPEKAKDRLEVLELMKEYEKEGKFDVDLEKDPPTIVLTPGQVDYLRKKYLSKVKTKVAYSVGKQFFNSMLKNNKIIIKKINGLENWNEIKSGAIVTCNHFNPFDCFTIEKVFRDTVHYKNKKYLYKVIREGNYTNFPGFYGFLMRNCYTMPLSSNKHVMMEFLDAQSEALQSGDFILMYPEQSLWWNYRKPKPLKDGAYKIAVKNKVPVLPIFITMEDSDYIGFDGFPIQEYTVNILPAIYPSGGLSDRENAINMKNTNYEMWKDTYEDFYHEPLKYTTDPAKLKELL
jgi:1-acyl-sn-glycerol-3-phosphate acyltransferase